MKNRVILFFTFILLVLCSYCSVNEVDNRTKYVTLGTVVYVEIEGGFYGIIDENAVQLDPINLPDTFKVNGRGVYIEFVIVENQANIHQWGTLIEIIDIESVN